MKGTFLAATLLSFAFIQAATAGVPNTFNFEGVLTDQTSGSPITTTTLIKFRILSASGSCVLLEEEQSIVPAADGSFAIKIGAGTRGSLDSGLALSDVFDNSRTFSASTPCPSGYAPGTNDGRLLRVVYNSTDMTPDFNLSSVPFAMVAQSLQGRVPADLIQVKNNGSIVLNQTNAEFVFSTTNFAKLSDFLNGTISYIPSSPTAAVSFNNQLVQNVASPVSNNDAANKGYVDNKASMVGGKATNLTGVGPGLGNGKTLVWDQASNGWTTGDIVDSTKLPLAGGSMAGPIAMNGYDISNTGNIGIGASKTLKLSSFSLSGESSVTSSFTTTDRGRMWFNSDLNLVRYFDGTTAVNIGASTPINLVGDVSGGGAGTISTVIGSGVIRTQHIGTNPGVNRLVGTDASTGMNLGFFSCALGEVLKWTATGWACSGLNAMVVQGGNTFSAPMAIGTNDSYPIYLMAGAVPRIMISPAGNIGIGTTVPQALLHISGNTLPVYMESFDGSGPALKLRSATGSSLSPTVTTTGSGLGSFGFYGYGTTLFSSQPSVRIAAIAADNFTDTTGGASLAFYTRPIGGSGSPIERLRIDSSGKIGIGISSPTMILDVGGDVRINGVLIGRGNNSLPYNTVVGVNALSTVTGNMNTAVGAGAGSGLSSGTGNLLLGYLAGSALTSGSYNVVIGGSSGSSIATSSNNILISDGSGNERLRIDGNGNVGIGMSTPAAYRLQVAGDIVPSTSAVYSLGTSSLPFLTAYFSTAATIVSDRRMKEQISDLDLGLEFIRRLRAVSYRLKAGDDHKVHYGLIAQEAEETLNDLRVNSEDLAFVMHDSKTDHYGLRYTELIAPLIRSVQELYQQFTGLDKKMARLEEQNRLMKNWICAKDRQAEFCAQ